MKTKENSNAQDYFYLLKKFLFKVPATYDHEKQLWEHDRILFRFHHSMEKHSYINDNNFSRVSSKMEPGKSYVVKIFRRNRSFGNYSTEDALSFLLQNNASFVGPQGLSTIMLEASKRFPKGKPVISFDLEKNCWTSPEGITYLTYGGIGRRGGCVLRLERFDQIWNPDYCFLCVCGK